MTLDKHFKDTITDLVMTVNALALSPPKSSYITVLQSFFTSIHFQVCLSNPTSDFLIPLPNLDGTMPTLTFH